MCTYRYKIIYIFLLNYYTGRISRFSERNDRVLRPADWTYAANVRAGDRRQHGGRRLARHYFGRGALAAVLRKCAQRRRTGKTNRTSIRL